MKGPTGIQKLAMAALNRRLWRLWPARLAVLKANRERKEVGIYKNGKTKYKYKYLCCICKGWFDKVDVNHKEPRIDPAVGWVSLDEWVLRTFVGEGKLDVRCRSCHQQETDNQTKQRVKTRRSKSAIPQPIRRKRKNTARSTT